MQETLSQVRQHVIIICGGRDFEHTNESGEWLLFNVNKINPYAILHGAARGADQESAAHLAVNGFGDRLFPFPADWNKHGKSAGPIRNQEMLTWALRTGFPVTVMAFPGGVGTGHMKKIAERAGCEVLAYGEGA